MFGAVSGAILTASTGYIVSFAGYLPLFIYASSAYLLALLIIHRLVPKLEDVQLKLHE